MVSDIVTDPHCYLDVDTIGIATYILACIRTSRRYPHSQSIPLESLVDLELGRQLQRLGRTAVPYPDAVHAALDDPARDPLLPVRHGVLVEGELGNFALTGREVDDLREGLQLQWRVRELGRRREGDVELDDFGAGNGAGVSDLDGRGHGDVVVRNLCVRDRKLGEVEGRVRETMARRKNA